ncbi:LacI family DNA-binding transcriptional regulator [Cohnella cellulosilytica]|uniref:LacI family DNA-binding transcriptional regulator n=1 Tax=Cohnella cellulosilytica TaxID=986710 RepID=A0ABW2F5S4_9BACL
MNNSGKRNKKPTIKEIAALTGFSPATVSLVLNNKGSFPDETRSAILQAFGESEPKRGSSQELRYIRLMMEESTSSRVTDAYNSDIIAGIESECQALGFEIILSIVRSDHNVEQWTDGVAGIIMLGGGGITDALIERVRSERLPILLVDNYVHQGDVSSVHADHYGAGFLAAQYLIDQGHRSIGFISGPAKYKPLVDRYAGYCAALMENGLPLNPHYVAPNEDRMFVKGFMEMKYLMELADRPTAVFAVSDRAALGAVQALEELGLVQGKDVELIGCDDIPDIRSLQPPIPTIRVPRIEVGQMAVRFLSATIGGNRLPGKIVLPARLVRPEAAPDAN